MLIVNYRQLGQQGGVLCIINGHKEAKYVEYQGDYYLVSEPSAD